MSRLQLRVGSLEAIPQIKVLLYLHKQIANGRKRERAWDPACKPIEDYKGVMSHDCCDRNQPGGVEGKWQQIFPQHDFAGKFMLISAECKI